LLSDARRHQYDGESFRVAAVQASPEYMDREATVAKTCRLVREAAEEGAALVGFPETFIPGYPYWNWVNAPIDGYDWYERYRKQAVDVPGPAVDQLASVADETDTTVVVGVTERDPNTVGTLYNTNLVISHEGELLGKHRKLVPTHAEKLSWGRGDGSSVRVYETPHGNLGTLACGENTNPLARYALLAQGEQVHVANQGYFTAVVGPQGEIRAGPLGDEEGIVYADVSVDETVEPKLMHDVVGQYNRFDVFDFGIDRDELRPYTERGRGPASDGDRERERSRDGERSDAPRPAE